MNLEHLIRRVVQPFSAENRVRLVDLQAQLLDALQENSPPPHVEVISRQVERVSALYNGLAEGNTFEQASLLDARLHFFLPTDVPKTWLPLGEVIPKLAESHPRRLEILDLGAGLGTGVVGTAMTLHLAGFRGEASFTCVEPDRILADRLSSVTKPLSELNWITLKARSVPMHMEEYLHRFRDDRFDLVLVISVLSEAFDSDEYEASTLALLQRLLKEKVKKTGALVVIEPALKRFSRPISAVRNQLTAVRAPCLADECPLLKKKDSFCFHSTRVPPHPLLQSVSSRSGLNRHEVNYTYLTLSPGAADHHSGPHQEDGQPEELWGRIISFPKRVKLGFQYFVCTPGGVVNAVVPRWLASGEESLRGKNLPFGARALLEPTSRRSGVPTKTDV